MNPFKKPLEPLSRDSHREEKWQFLNLNQQSFAELLTFIDFADRFTIGFVEINFPPDTDILIELLKNHRQCQEIQFCCLEFADPELRFLRDEIVKILPTVQLEPNKKLVLIIRGLENSIGMFGDYPPVLTDLNFVRDGYKTSVPHPVIFILPDYAITRLAKFAPDFWDWKSGVFQFKTDQSTRDNAFAQVFDSGQAPVWKLDPPEKQERIDLLHRLLMEYNPSGQQLKTEDIDTCINILQQLGRAYISQRNPGKAREYLERALNLADCHQNLNFKGETLGYLGQVYLLENQIQKAIDYSQKCLEIALEIGDRTREGYALINIGSCYYLLGQYQQAIDYYSQCLEVFREIGDRPGESYALINLGTCYSLLEQYNQAIDYYSQCLEIFREIGDRAREGYALNSLGNCYK